MKPPQRKRYPSFKLRENEEDPWKPLEQDTPDDPWEDSDPEQTHRTLQRSSDRIEVIDYSPAIKLETIDEEYGLFALLAIHISLLVLEQEQQQQPPDSTTTSTPSPNPNTQSESVQKTKEIRRSRAKLAYADYWEDEEVPKLVKLDNNHVKVGDTIVSVDCVNYLKEEDVPLAFDPDTREVETMDGVEGTCTLSCRLGCICDSINGDRWLQDHKNPLHCRNPKCFFGPCSCPILNRPVVLEERLRSRDEVRRRMAGRALKTLVNASNTRTRKRRTLKKDQIHTHDNKEINLTQFTFKI